MADKIPHHVNLRDVIRRGVDHLKAALDCGGEVLITLLEDHRAETDRAVETSKPIAPAASDDPLMTAVELGAYLNIKPATLRGWAREGRIPFEPVGRERRFRRSVIDKWIEANKTKQSSPTRNNGVELGRSILRPANHRSKSNGRV